ncbi:MAG: replicative DNA helicase [Desulfotomaculum sp.]|nr:replicative DNA helicase [Desulfotomaculum sp.]MCL0052695.1 replicative DNA helicase [Peptococcaceae bacterium]
MTLKKDNFFQEQELPQSIDAEQAVLGSILLDKESIYKVMEIINPDDFYSESHRLIYKAMLNLADRDQPIDMITVSEELKKNGSLEKAGGASYIALLAGVVPTARNVEHYAHIVEEKSLKRMLIQLSTKVSAMSYEEKDVHELIDQAEEALIELRNRCQSKNLTAVNDILVQLFEQIEKMQQNRGKLTGISTGFIDLDNITCGLQNGDLIVLAARPSMGKTTLGLMIALNAAVRLNVPTAIFSLEMSKTQLVQRMLCAEAMVDQQKLRAGFLKDEDWLRLTQAGENLSHAPLYIDDTAILSPREILAKARNLKKDKNLGLIVIDYMQLMQGNRRAENRQQEISDISRSLKGIAKELNVPVLALSQLSRAVEQRQNKRPIMPDLRESGSIEQDADVVMFIYRDEYYNPESEKAGIAEIIIAKQRNGPVGKVELGFIKQCTKFVNLAKEEF